MQSCVQELIRHLEGEFVTKEKRFPNEFYLIVAVSITTWIAEETAQPILPLYITRLGATSFQLGLIVSILSFVTIAAKIPLGMLAERVGRWRIVPVVAIGQTVIFLLYSIVEDVQWLYPIRVAHAIVLAAFIPTALSIVLELAPSGKRGEVMGMFLASVGVGAMVGPFLCMLLLNYVDYAYFFRIVSMIPLLGLVPFLIISRKDSEVILPREKNTGFLTFMKDIVHSRNLLVVSYLRLVFSFTNAFLLTLFALHTQDTLLLAPSVIALLFGVKGTIDTFSRIPSGKLGDKIGCRWPIFLAFTLLIVTHYIISVAKSLFLLVFAMAIYGLAQGMRAVSEWSLLGESSSAETRNIATAYLSTIFNVGTAFGGVFAGALNMIINTSTIFRMASLIVITGCFAVTLIKTSKYSGEQTLIA